jgi:hypothetical protein
MLVPERSGLCVIRIGFGIYFSRSQMARKCISVNSEAPGFRAFQLVLESGM